jgi:hypothetical protein
MSSAQSLDSRRFNLDKGKRRAHARRTTVLGHKPTCSVHVPDVCYVSEADVSVGRGQPRLISVVAGLDEQRYGGEPISPAPYPSSL